MNQLHLETSPYLLQHQSNPIFWKAWNTNTLKDAKTSNKLIVVSIGYSACHWCHVMEHECFEDHEVADVMNANYISIKVDREERPDVDAVYMKALQLMTRQGGWPLNVVCLPNGKPVWGATYVNKPNWIQALKDLQDLYESQPERMVEYADKLQLGLNHTGLIEEQEVENPFDIKTTEQLVIKWSKSFDWDYGGPARSPKFMMPTNLNFLQNYGSYIKNEDLLDYVDLTLTRMAWGGLYDVVEGGFSRYSVDMRWHIPHFEKMLYDNGQLLQTYSNAYKRTKNPLYKQICYQTFNFIKQNWLLENGLVQSAYDADSLNKKGKLQEGAFYSWNLEDLKQLLDTDFEWFASLYNINEFGFWEEENEYVFIQTQTESQIAEQFNFELEELLNKKADLLNKLKDFRNVNKQIPRLDDKCITSWNALYVIGCLECFEAFGDQEFLNAAEKNIIFIINNLINPETGILSRNFKEGKITINGFLDDYAFLIKALFKLYQNTLKPEFALEAKKLADFVLDNFYNENISLFEFKHKSEDKLVATHFEIEDNVIPSSNAIMAQNLWLLGLLFENEYYQKITKQMAQKVLPSIDYGSAFSEWLQLNIWLQNEFENHIFVGNNIKEVYVKELSLFNYNRHLIGANIKEMYYFLEKKYKINKNLLYVCNNLTCTKFQNI